jgi:outer membrane protein OmpA-like peptidoglycan-associated protein
MLHAQSRIAWIYALLLGLIVTFYASQAKAGAGTTSDNFLNIGVGARPAAMGNAYLALADDANAIQWNPAGLARLDYPEVTFMHLAYFADINYEYLGVGVPWHGQGLGFGLTWLNVPPFNSTLDPNAEQGSASSYSLALGYAVNLSPRLQVGVTVRSLLENLASTSSIGGSLDAGATFTPWGRNLALAVVAQNLGVDSGFAGVSDPLPIDLRFGAAYSVFDSSNVRFLNLVLDLGKSLDDKFLYNAGAEWWLFHTLALRAGYMMSEGGQDFSNSDPNAPANFTAGLGFRFNALQLDYAFVPYGELGVTNRLSASWKFGYTPIEVDKEAVLQASPKFSGEAGGAQGVAFAVDASKAMHGAAVKEWSVQISDENGRVVRTLFGEGSVPQGLVWDMKDADGNPVDGTQSFKYGITLRDWDGHSVHSSGFIAREIRPKEMMSSMPNYDPASGGLVFKPKSSMNVDVKEWKLNIRDQEGNILKTITGTGAIPKNLVWNPVGSGAAGTSNLLAGRTIAAIKYDLEIKDNQDHATVVSDQVRFAMGQVQQEAYHLPLPIREFKVNKGNEILVAALPDLTSAQPGYAGAAPFVMPVPKAGDIRSWRLDIMDRQGRVLRSFKGGPGVPENIFWDGMDDNGILVKNPEQASFRFAVLGSQGLADTTARRSVRNPFTLATANGSITKISGIWFRFLDTDIQESVLGKLKEVAAMLRRDPKVQVTIQGHAWDEGAPAEALRLSQDRADTVLRYLIEDEGLTPRNVSSIGYGDAMPLVDAHDADADSKNRRVEVIIVSK